MSNAAKNVYHIDELKEIKSAYNAPKRIDSEHSFGDKVQSAFSNFESSGGGGNMDNFVTRKEFEQFEKRMDENLKSINSTIDGIPDRIDEKLDTKIEKMKNEQMRWFAVTIIGILGIAGRVFGLY